MLGPKPSHGRCAASSDPQLGYSSTCAPSEQLTKCLLVVATAAPWQKASLLSRGECDEVHMVHQERGETIQQFSRRVEGRLRAEHFHVLTLAVGKATSPWNVAQLLPAELPLLVRLYLQLDGAPLPSWIPELAETLMLAGVQVELRFETVASGLARPPLVSSRPSVVRALPWQVANDTVPPTTH